MARLLSKIAAEAAKKSFSTIENVYVKDAMFFTGVSADTDLVSAGYIWASMYFYDTTKGVKENIDILSCIELDSEDTVSTLVNIAKANGIQATNEKPLNILLRKTKIPLRYRKHSNTSTNENVDQLF